MKGNALISENSNLWKINERVITGMNLGIVSFNSNQKFVLREKIIHVHFFLFYVSFRVTHRLEMFHR